MKPGAAATSFTDRFAARAAWGNHNRGGRSEETTAGKVLKLAFGESFFVKITPTDNLLSAGEGIFAGESPINPFNFHQPTNMNRIDRLMGIITLLQAKKHLSVPQIAGHFDISERTVFRDLRAIGEIGVPIHFEPEKGYSVSGGFFLPPVSLTVEEANALSLAEPLIVRFADKSIQQHFGTALTKIKMVLGRSQQESMERSQEQAAHFIPDNYAHLMPSTSYLTPLQNAIVNKTIVRIEYLNQKEEHSVREVEPIGLTFYSLNWHLIAWCHLRQGYRDFRTSRIQNLKVTLQPFLKNDHIGLDEYLQNLQKLIAEKTGHPLT